MGNQNNENKDKQNIQHPLFGISPKNWIQLLDKNGGVDNKFLERGLFITLSSIFTAPARATFQNKIWKKNK